MNNSQKDFINKVCYEMQYRNYSTSTITTYTSLLKQIEHWTGVPIEEVSTGQLKAYLHHRIAVEKVSISVINQSISAFKILQSDILGREWEQFKIKRPRREIKMPVVLSLEEVENLISATTNVKHKAILMLAYSAGLRKTELQQIKPQAIDSKRMLVHISQGKGKKDRFSILSQKTLTLLRFYYSMYRPQTYLFESQQYKGRYLAATSLSGIVKNNAKKAGIKKNISFHTLRHCFATHLMESGVNLKIVQKLLGHNSIRTTSRYLHLVNIDPAKIVSPADSMNV